MRAVPITVSIAVTVTRDYFNGAFFRHQWESLGS